MRPRVAGPLAIEQASAGEQELRPRGRGDLAHRGVEGCLHPASPVVVAVRREPVLAECRGQLGHQGAVVFGGPPKCGAQVVDLGVESGDRLVIADCDPPAMLASAMVRKCRAGDGAPGRGQRAGPGVRARVLAHRLEHRQAALAAHEQALGQKGLQDRERRRGHGLCGLEGAPAPERRQGAEGLALGLFEQAKAPVHRRAQGLVALGRVARSGAQGVQCRQAHRQLLRGEQTDPRRCHTDIHAARGVAGQALRASRSSPGHEGVGVVEELAQGPSRHGAAGRHPRRAAVARLRVRRLPSTATRAGRRSARPRATRGTR